MSDSPIPPKAPSKKTPQGPRDRGEPGANVPDGATQEVSAAKQAMDQGSQNRHRQINEGGRSHDSAHKKNPPGAVHAVPEPSKRETGR